MPDMNVMFFKIPEGSISVELRKNEQILVSYEDGINVKLMTEEKNKHITDDI